MSRRVKTIVVLGFELLLAAAFCASFAYFVLESRDFLAGAGVPGAAKADSPR